MIKISLNNEARELPDNTSVKTALYMWGYRSQPPFAVAVNRVFLPRNQYPDTLLRDQDQLDIVQAISGG